MHDRKFAAFILTHGRADNVLTYKTLRNSGYTGEVYFIIDNEDEQEEQYRKNFGDKVIVFDKEKYFQESDACDNSQKKNIVLPARNACFDIAKQLGLTHFLELDDDYSWFEFRVPEGNELKSYQVKNMDAVINAYFDFLDLSPALTVTFFQGGDFIGGADSTTIRNGFKRKAMNSFFCRVDRPFKFLGRINEDTNAYCLLQRRGRLMIQPALVSLVQKQTQSNAGGLTDAYIENGTYVKSFYSIIVCPSAVKISAMNSLHSRIHHKINYDRCAALIISDKYKKNKK